MAELSRIWGWLSTTRPACWLRVADPQSGRLLYSGKEAGDYFAVDVGEAAIDAVVAEG
jgi:hypothetical protein